MLNTVGVAETRIFYPNHEYLLYDVASLATVQLSSSWAGQNFEVYITGITGGQTRTIQLETNATYDGAKTPVFKRSGIAYNAGTKTYTFSENGDEIKKPKDQTYPIDIPKYEKLNNIKINVFEFND
jgi:hypothetical protein